MFISGGGSTSPSGNDASISLTNADRVQAQAELVVERVYDSLRSAVAPSWSAQPRVLGLTPLRAALAFPGHHATSLQASRRSRILRRMSVALRSLLPSRRRSLFALGALTFGLGLTARWHTLAPLSARPLFLRPFSAFTVNAPVMSGHAAPQPPPRWNHAPDEVRQLTKDAIQRDREVRECSARRCASDC
jgi:hypothetical protein